MIHSSHHSRRRSRRRPIESHRGTRRPARRPPSVRVSVEQEATVALIRVSGEFDLSAVGPVERALDRAIDPLTDKVRFDLRAVSFLDLCGLRTLVRADQRARRGSYVLEIVPPPGPAARIFALTAVGRALRLVDAP